MTIPNLFHCIIHATLIRFCVMGHVWNMTRWGRLELKYYKLQALQMCRSAFQYKIGNPEYLSQYLSWFPGTTKEQQTWAEECNSTGSSQTPKEETCPWCEVQASFTILTSPGTAEKMMCMWESRIALMEFKQVRGSRMNRVQWEKNFYKVNLKTAQWLL